MRDPVSSAQLDDLVLAAAHSPGSQRRELARRLRGWAEDPHPLDEPSPRELFLQAGEQLELDGDQDAALELYETAIASHGPVTLDPRCFVVALLHSRGQHQQADEVEQELRRSRPEEAATYEYMGELCEGLGEPVSALGWYNRGISLAEDQGLVEADMGRLCLGRWRLRERMGQDRDQFDEFGRDYLERVQRGAGHG